jgi:hypothetical protein
MPWRRDACVRIYPYAIEASHIHDVKEWYKLYS